MNGILFKPDIWQAKLAVLERTGEAETRRLDGLKEINKEPGAWRVWDKLPTIDGSICFERAGGDVSDEKFVKPRYHAGQVVYVRESWAGLASNDNVPICDMPHDSGIIFYKADKPDAREPIRGKWRSPLFMPAWCARHFVKILDVQPELFKLSNMTAKDIEEEGGEPALEYLGEYDGKWLWVYRLILVPRPEQVAG